MTTKQTIDGVPSELLEQALLDARRVRFCTDNQVIELRALLDAPAEPKPTGLSQGWNLTRKHDGFVVGHQSVAYQPDEKAIERAERDGYVWVPFLVPAAQSRGVPVAMNREQFEAWVLDRAHPTYGWLDKHWLTRGDNPENYADPYVQGLWVASHPLYAEQPAPVVLVPDGWTVVPLEATGVMKDAGAFGALPVSCANAWTAAAVWRAMINAAPSSQNL